MSNGTPPTGHDWGERTTQSRTHAPRYWKPDAYEMRMKYGLEELDVDGEFREPELTDLTWPDLLIHETDVERGLHPPGGRPVLVEGKRGSGKTTLFLHAAIRILDESDDVVLWRGSQNRSGWLPLRHWATVWLPADVEVDATWMTASSGPGSEAADDGGSLEEVVRSVRRYEDVQELLGQLGDVDDATFHVVYPDPVFRGCEQVATSSTRTSEPLPFNPRWEPGKEGPTPLIHWWYAFQVARIEDGPHRWMTLLFDEARQFTPGGQQMRQDDQLSRSKVAWLSDALTDARRALFSPWYANHKRHHMLTGLQAEFNYRIDMPDGSESPYQGSGRTPPGMSQVPMTQDLMSDKQVGTGLAYAEGHRSWFRWADIAGRDDLDNRALHVRLEVPDELAEALADEADDVEDDHLEFDDGVFSEWQNQMDHRLYVKSPGEGWISLVDGEIGEELRSPMESLRFDPGVRVREDGLLEVLMTDDDGREVPVARFDVDVDDVGGTEVPFKLDDGGRRGAGP